jgi:hypothetical protein
MLLSFGDALNQATSFTFYSIPQTFKHHVECNNFNNVLDSVLMTASSVQAQISSIESSEISTLVLPNTPPRLAVNSSISSVKGTTVIFNDTQLKAIDSEQDSRQLVYALTQLPEAGILKLNGTPLKMGNTFTQADINIGHLVYSSFGREQRLTINDIPNKNPKISGYNIVWNTLRDNSKGCDSFKVTRLGC